MVRVLIGVAARKILLVDTDAASDADIDANGETLIGWQRVPGFPLEQIAATVEFAKLPGIITPYVLRLKTPEDLPAGGELILTYETSMFLRCDFDFLGRGGWRRARRFATGDDFEDYREAGGLEMPTDGTMPKIATCQVSDKYRQVTLTFMDVLPEGAHSFAALAETLRWWQPGEDPTPVAVRMVSPENGTILGAVYELPGTEVVFGVKMGSPSVEWDPGASDPLSADAMVTLVVNDPLEDNTPDPKDLLRLIVQMPEGYSHSIRTPDDLTIYPPVTPHPAGNEMQIFKRGFVLDLKPSMTSPGTHSLKFKAQANAKTPPINLWYVRFCQNLCEITESGKGVIDAAAPEDVVVTFPMPGIIPRMPPPPPVVAAAGTLVLLAAVIRW
jgi:hypothetical protein